MASRSIAAVVLTFNEEKNLRACLDSLRAVTDAIFVVDSGSTDGTLSIARESGATIVQHPFTTHAEQWKWALENLPLDSEWVLALDADQRLSPGLQSEVRAFIASAPSFAGVYLRRLQMFRGSRIRFGGYGNKHLLKLFRLNAVRLDGDEFVDHHFHVTGPTTRMKHVMIEENHNEDDIGAWIAKHNRYAALQAREELMRVPPPGRFFGSPDERVRWLKRGWARQPLYVRPFIYFFYRYFVRLGILDGKQGLIFHFMQALWYRLLVDVNISQLRADNKQ